MGSGIPPFWESAEPTEKASRETRHRSNSIALSCAMGTLRFQKHFGKDLSTCLAKEVSMVASR